MAQTEWMTGVLPEGLRLTDLPELVDLLLASKKVRLTIKSSSMFPTLLPGDRIEVETGPKGTPKPGDLILFQRDRHLICHRLVGLFKRNGETWAKTKGDASEVEDRPFRADRIIGRVYAVERKGKVLNPFDLANSVSWKARVLFAVYHFRQGVRTPLRGLLLSCQSVKAFRRLSRTLFRWKTSYFLGIPASSHRAPRFWIFREAALSDPGLLKALEGKRAFRFLAKVKGSVVGSLEAKAEERAGDNVWQISHLFVRIPFRGRGIATALVASASSLLRQRGVSVLKTEIESHNRPALAFLNRLGFLAIQPLSHDTLIRNAARQLLLEQALTEIASSFHRSDIPFLVLKGMALAYLVYPDPATRTMVDIDLLIRTDQIREASAALLALGYQPMGHYGTYQEELIRFGGELAFRKPHLPTVELHWNLEQYERLKGLIRIDEEALWQRAISYSVNGLRLQTLCPEDQLLTLSIHLGLIHRMQGEKWLLDIDQLLRVFEKEMDWALVMERARQWGIARLLGHVLWRSHQTFGTPLPPKVPLRPVWGWRTPAGELFFLDRWPDRCRVVKRVLFPSGNWLRFRYHLKKGQPLFPYRCLHPFRVLFGRFS